MAVTNPYDRRQSAEERRAREFRTDGMAMSPLLNTGFEQPRALAIEDIEAVAFSAQSRGRSEATEWLDQRHAEALHHGRREAWEEGHAAGTVEGQRALLRTINDQHGIVVNDLIAKAGATLKREKTTRRDLHEMLSRTVACLERLVRSHHEGFTDLEF